MNHTFQSVLLALCKYYNVDESYIFKDSRKKNVIAVRHMFVYQCYINIHNFKWTEIARFFSSKGMRTNFSHSNAICSVNRMIDLTSIYSYLKTDCEEISKILNEPKNIVPNNVDLLSLSLSYSQTI